MCTWNKRPIHVQKCLFLFLYVPNTTAVSSCHIHNRFCILTLTHIFSSSAHSSATHKPTCFAYDSKANAFLQSWETQTSTASKAEYFVTFIHISIYEIDLPEKKCGFDSSEGKLSPLKTTDIHKARGFISTRTNLAPPQVTNSCEFCMNAKR